MTPAPTTPNPYSPISHLSRPPYGAGCPRCRCGAGQYSYAALSGRRSGAAHAEAGRGRPHRHRAGPQDRQGARGGQGRAADQVPVRCPPGAVHPRRPAAVPGPFARHHHPGRGDPLLRRPADRGLPPVHRRGGHAGDRGPVHPGGEGADSPAVPAAHRRSADAGGGRARPPPGARRLPAAVAGGGGLRPGAGGVRPLRPQGPAARVRDRGRRHGVHELPPARGSRARPRHHAADGRPAPGRLGHGGPNRTTAADRVQWLGGRLPAVAPGALHPFPSSRGACVTVRPPDPHPSGARPPALPRELIPQHVAIVMDGDGRWAKQRGLPRTEGHKEGESSLLDVIMGAIELGIPYLSAYAFSTENWRRSPDEVRFLMGFNRDVIHRRRDLLNEMGVRIRWAGRRRRLWRSVISELEEAERMSAGNSVLTLQFCVNYGGRAEIADAVSQIAADVAAGRLRPDKVNEKTISRYLYEPEIPDVDLFVRSSGEHRTSNFLVWQSHYAELVFLDTLWPDFDRRHLWHACEIYASRDRRYGGAIPNQVAGATPLSGS